MDEEKYLNDEPVAEDKLKELKETLPKDKRLVEKTPNHFVVLERLKG
jgi:hypothetical protein